jgi:hypothetical protein
MGPSQFNIISVQFHTIAPAGGVQLDNRGQNPDNWGQNLDRGDPAPHPGRRLGKKKRPA